MRLFLLITFFASFAFASLPPTSSRLQNETTSTTTFFTEYPRFTGSHSGVTTTLGGEILSTGLISGGNLSINVTPTLFDLSQATVQFFDYSASSLNPSVKQVTCGPYTGQSVPNLATQPFTYVLVDSTCTLQLINTIPTPTQRRQWAFIGRLNHSNFTSITFANDTPDYLASPVSLTYDLYDALGPFNITGNIVTANGANLSFNKSSGAIFQRGANYATSTQDPNFNTTGGLTAASFRYATQTQTAGSNVTVIDPTNYDVAGTITAVPNPTATATVQRIYLFRDNTLRVLYGQATYANLALAIQGFPNESFVVNPTVEGFAVLIGFVAIQKNCTSLQDTSCSKIILAPKFSQGGSGGGTSGGTTTLQQAYNNSVQPQITLTSTALGIQVRDASTPIGSSLFAVQNNAGSTSYLGVDVNGISTTNFVGTGTAGAVRLHNLTTTQKNALTSTAGMMLYDTTLLRFQCAYANGGTWSDCDRPYSLNQGVTGGGTITIDVYAYRQMIRLSPSSAVTLSSTPFGSSAPPDYAEITLIGTSNTNTVTITANDASKGVMDYDVTLGLGDSVTFVYSPLDDRYYYKATGH